MKYLVLIIWLCLCQNVLADFNTGDTFGKGFIVQNNGTTLTGGGRTLNFASGVSVVNNAYYITGSGGGGGSPWTITDGSNTVSNVSNLTVSGGTVGGTTPNATLTITGGSSQWTGTAPGNIYYNQGNVGVGSSNPGQALDVTGTVRISGNVGIGTQIPSTLGSFLTIQGNSSSDFPVPGSETLSNPGWTLNGWGGTWSGGFTTAPTNTGTLTGSTLATIGTSYKVSVTITGGGVCGNCGVVNFAFGGVSGLTVNGTGGSTTTSDNYVTATATTAFTATPLYNQVTGTIFISIKPLTSSIPFLLAKNSSGTSMLEMRAPNTLTFTSNQGNLAIGTGALSFNESGSNDVAFGIDALQNSLTSTSNAAFGAFALQNVTTASNNLAMGFQAMQSTTIGGQNVALGSSALTKNTTGTQNMALGTNASSQSISGSLNVAVGNAALQNSTVSDNTAVGVSALANITSGSDNTALGANAGQSINSGSSNQTSIHSIYIGEDSRAAADGDTTEIVIGDTSKGNGSHTTTIGNASSTNTLLPSGNLGIGTVAPLGILDVNRKLLVTTSGNVGIGSLSPGQILDIQGNARMTGFIDTTSPTNGYVMTTDSSGNGTWQPGGSGTTQWTGTSPGPIYYASGNVGIGTLIPSQTLDVQGTIRVIGNVGIGTVNPSHALQIGNNGDAPTSRRMGVNSDGNVGIGPFTDALQTSYYLDIADLFLFSPSQFAYFGSITQQVSGATTNTFTAEIKQNGPDIRLAGGLGSEKLYFGNDNNTFIQPTADTSTADLQFETNALERMRISLAGNVGIGSTAPGTMLDVQGTIRSIGVNISGLSSSSSICTDGSKNLTTSGCSGGSASAAGGTNAVQYNSGSSTFAGKENVFSFNGTNVGIGTTNGVSLFDIEGTINTRAFEVTSAGNIGIGTTTPQTQFSVLNGNVGIGTWTATTRLAVAGTSNFTGNVTIGPVGNVQATWSSNNGSLSGIQGNASQTLDATQSVSAQQNGTYTIGNNSALSGTASTVLEAGTGGSQTVAGSSIKFNIAGSTLGTFLGGNLGIGSVTPGQILDVQGTIRVLKSGDVLVPTGNVGIGTTFVSQAGGGEGALSVMNGNVGIGTWVPSASLNIVGTGNNIFSTNVGIGTLTAGSTFVVSGTGNNFIGANLGVGQKIPGVELDVQGTVRFTKSLLNTTSSTGIGWSEHNATNQACNTTCGTSACVMGLDIGTVGVINSGFVACTDATADDCICAGP